MAIDATVGGAAANSYVTQAAATTYFSGRLDVAAWTAASSSDKDAALMMATVRLDTELYVGTRVFIDQRLKWPRYGAPDPDGLLYDHLTIPLILQEAEYELALALLVTPTMFGDSGLEAFQNVKVGSIDVTPRAVAAAALPSIVKRLISPVRKGGFGASVVRA